MPEPQAARPRRIATARLVAAVLGVALATYTTIALFQSRAAGLEAQQLRVMRLDRDMTKTMDDLDVELLGERTDSVRDGLRRVEKGMADVAGHGREVELAEVSEAYRRLSRSIHDELAAIEGGSATKARRIDNVETEAAFAQVERAMAVLNAKLEAKAETLSEAAGVAEAATMLVCAIVVIGLVLRFRRQVEANLTLELRQRSAESSERRLRALIQNNTDVIVLTDAEGIVSMASDASETAWGRTQDSLLGTLVHGVVEPADSHRLRAAFLGCRANGQSVVMEAKALRIDGVAGEFEVRLANLLHDADASGMLLTFHDLTERKRLEREMVHQAFHDRLTGLPNRALFLDRLAQRQKARNGAGFALLFIDLDNFKVINDSLGHEAGDTLLIEVAARLGSVLRSCDTVARMGGDEFTIVLDDAASEIEAADVAERILKALVVPVTLGDREIFVTCSIGVVVATGFEEDSAALLRDADTAMYQAKAEGKASFALFDPSMNVRALDRMELESDLRVAIENDQFFLAYQPIVDMSTGRLCEVEALVRWQHPTRGTVSPTAFIPLAEETGLVCAIGRWAMREALTQLALWNGDRAAEEPLRVSVNVSGRQLQEKDFVDEVSALLAELTVDPSLIELEVTETAMLKDLDRMQRVLSELRALGLRIAIDDFGTGYSSMAYLTRLPVDKLKIDRSFVIPIGEDARADGVVQAMITMARTLGLRVTGEGVETRQQLDMLRAMGCDLGQGYLFDRPLAASAVAELLAQSADALPIAA